MGCGGGAFQDQVCLLLLLLLFCLFVYLDHFQTYSTIVNSPTFSVVWGVCWMGTADFTISMLRTSKFYLGMNVCLK